MSERWPALMAVAAAGGAWVGTSWPGFGGRPLGDGLVLASGARVGEVLGTGLVPIAVLVVALGGVVVLRRPVLACLLVAVLAVTLGQRAVDGLDPVRRGPLHGELTLLTDPAPGRGGAIHAEVRWGRRRLAASAFQSAAAALDDRLAGERITVLGDVQPPGPYEQRMRHRHLVGRARIDTVIGWRAGHGVTRAANGIRRTLAAGASSLPEQQRALLMGLLLGDDRLQRPELTEAFQSAGLAHLLAVSGQNVGFVMALAAPLTMRLRFAPRLVVSLVVLAGFALVARGEPSVLRATAMAAVAVFGATTGRPTTGLRALAVAVTVLLLCDPLLVGSLGFRLSVAGAAGIILLAGPLQARLPGPDWLAAPLAVTAAAQLAVAPLLVAAFGSIRVASFPANLLALPAAGPLTMWGLTAGLAAGLIGGPIASVLHVPSRILLGWIAGVATHAANWPLGSLRLPHVAAVYVAAIVVYVSGRVRRPP